MKRVFPCSPSRVAYVLRAEADFLFPIPLSRNFQQAVSLLCVSFVALDRSVVLKTDIILIVSWQRRYLQPILVDKRQNHHNHRFKRVGHGLTSVTDRKSVRTERQGFFPAFLSCTDKKRFARRRLSCADGRLSLQKFCINF